jgi:hypothetical protein
LNIGLSPSGENIASATQRPESEMDNASDSTTRIATGAVDFSNGIPLWFYILREAAEIGCEINADIYACYENE